MARVCLDTSVILEYINLNGKYHEQAEIVFTAILNGQLEAYIPSIILAEVHYASLLLYERLGLENPILRAGKLISWLYKLPNIMIVNEDLNLILEASEIGRKYLLPLTTCFVLATSKINDCKAVFVKRLVKDEEIRNLEREVDIIYLEDY